MLDHAQVVELRARVTRATLRQTFKVPVRWTNYQGGPLDDLRIDIPDRLTVGKSIGWCYVTDRGPVSAMYRWDGEAWRWDEWEPSTMRLFAYPRPA